jgi:hypothetical protein
MMKALNPKARGHERAKADGTWVEIFEKLQRLCKAEVLVCPSSAFHTEESALFPYPAALRRIDELMSFGAAFYDDSTIQRFQVIKRLDSWLEGGTPTYDFRASHVMHGRIHEWKERYVISVSFADDDRWVDELRKGREQVTDELRKVSEYWCTETGNSFVDFFRDEASSWGRNTLMIYANYVKEFVRGHQLVSPTPAVVMVTEAQEHLRKAGIGEDDILQKTAEYFQSEVLWDIPFIKISLMMWAAMARKFVAGRKNPLNRGMAKDVHS